MDSYIAVSVSHLNDANRDRFVVARSQGKYFDEKYLYDQIHRLKDMSRGELGSGGSTLSNKQFTQCWGLDETGNWSNFREDNTGAGTWTLKQSKTSDTVNEITEITHSQLGLAIGTIHPEDGSCC